MLKLSSGRPNLVSRTMSTKSLSRPKMRAILLSHGILSHDTYCSSRTSSSAAEGRYSSTDVQSQNRVMHDKLKSSAMSSSCRLASQVNSAVIAPLQPVQADGSQTIRLGCV